MIITGISTGLALLIPSYKGILLALFLSQLQMLWDCCDGELARWKKKFSPAGIFLDTIGHYSAEATIVLMLGLRAASWPDNSLNESNFPFFGALLAIIIILNKVLNDAVHVARFFTGGSRNNDDREIGKPKSSLLSNVRSVARFFPLHKMFHSVEMTIVISLASAIGYLTNQENPLQLLINWALPISGVVLIGHLIAILSSRKLIVS
jgi:phosphatidylglycerophosphate synthase